MRSVETEMITPLPELIADAKRDRLGWWGTDSTTPMPPGLAEYYLLMDVVGLDVLEYERGPYREMARRTKVKYPLGQCPGCGEREQEIVGRMESTPEEYRRDLRCRYCGVEYRQVFAKAKAGDPPRLLQTTVLSEG